MKNREYKLLKSLIEIPSPSGFEQRLAQFIKKTLLQYLPKTRVETDFQNNVIAIIKGSQPDKNVIIDAHLDEIGFIVTNIDKEGLISLQYIGGGDNSILSARKLVILSDKGKINAVVNRKHAHLVDKEEDETIVKIAEAQVDIGIRKRRQVKKYIKIGDPVVYKSELSLLTENYFAGYGFDDKAGCFILMEIIKEITRLRKKPVPNLIFTFSAQEETWGTRVIPLVKKYKPQLFIEVDVSFATDYLDESLEREAGKCDLGKGIVIYRGVGIDKNTLKLLESTAKRNKIKVQYQASTGMDGYTSNDMSRYGIRALTVSPPLRNMHTSVEIINMLDLKYGIKLLKTFLLNRRLGKVMEKC